MKTIHTIEEAAKYFSLPKSTLLYWEQEGLIQFDRMPENQYRVVTAKTIFQIENVLSLRNLGIPVKKIKTAHLLSLEERLSLYENAVEIAEQKIQKISMVKECIKKQLDQIREIDYLRNHPYCTESPDFRVLIPHSQSTIAIECAETGRFVILIKEPSYNEIVETFINDEAKEGILWRRPNTGEWRSFLLDTVTRNDSRNLDNLFLHLQALQNMGLQTKTVVARYLSEGIEDGILHIYFKAYAQVKM